MRKRILFLIVGAIFIVGIVGYILYLKNGDEYNAAKDISKNRIRLLVIGLPVESAVQSMQILDPKYGFTHVFLGCTVTSSEVENIEDYNAEMLEYLTKKNGKGWDAKYQNELDSIEKKVIIK